MYVAFGNQNTTKQLYKIRIFESIELRSLFKIIFSVQNASDQVVCNFLYVRLRCSVTSDR